MIKKLESSVSTLKLNNTLRLVSRIVIGVASILLIVGISEDLSSIVWKGSAVVLSLCMLIFCGIIARNEYRLFEYAADVPITSLPKPINDPKFWEKRKNATVSLWGSFFFLIMGYLTADDFFKISIALMIMSIIALLYHIKEHPKRSETHRVSDMV